MWIRDFLGRLLGVVLGMISALLSPLAGLFGGLCDGLGGNRTESRTAEAFGLSLTLGALASRLLLAEAWEAWTVALLVSATTVVAHLGWGGRWLLQVRAEANRAVESRAPRGWGIRKACIGAAVGFVTAPIFAFRSALGGGLELLMTPVDSVMAGKEAGIRAWKGETQSQDLGFQQQAFCAATGRALSQSISLVGNRSSNGSHLEGAPDKVELVAS